MKLVPEKTAIQDPSDSSDSANPSVDTTVSVISQTKEAPVVTQGENVSLSLSSRNLSLSMLLTFLFLFFLFSDPRNRKSNTRS